MKAIQMQQQRGRARLPRRDLTPSVAPLLAEEKNPIEELDVERLDTLLRELISEEEHACNTLRKEQEGHHDDPIQEDVMDWHADPEDGDCDSDLPDTTASWILRSGKNTLLTPAQEIRLAKRVEQGDRRAKEEIINANVRLVASVARRYLGRGLPLEDLMQEGMIGLLRAVEKYNYRKGYRFSTYATHWIRQAISRGLANQGRSIRLPAHVVDSISRVARIREELFQRYQRPPTRQEVAEAAGISEKKLVQLLRSAAQPVSLETPVGEANESHYGDFLAADEESSPTDRVFRYLVREELEKALNTLTPREREVLVLRFGLNDEEPHTLEETGRILHITRERARQIEAKALEKLRHASVAGRLLDTVN